MPDGGAIASISSTAGSGYLANIAKWMPARHHERLRGGAQAWCEEHPDEIATGYSPSKEAICVWTHWAALDLAKKNVRVNCISPGPTDTPMMPAFEDFAGADLINKFAEGAGRRSRPRSRPTR